MSIGGKLTAWKHGSHGAPTTLVDYSNVTKSVDPPLSSEEVEQTTFGTGFRDYEASFKSGEINVTYKYTDAIWTVLSTIFNNQTTVDFQYSPDGTASTKPKIEGLAASGSGGMVLLELSPPTSVGEAMEISARFRMTGQITFGAH